MARVIVLLLYDYVLVRLAIEDYRYQKIKNCYVKTILLLSAVSLAVMPKISLISRVFGMFAVSLPMLLLGMFVPGSFGGGDVKLVFACGAFLGCELLLKGTAIALFLAGIYSIWLICIKKEKRNVQFALGPFLSVGYIISAFSIF